MALTCEYCDCCTSIVSHIGNHYDPDGLTKHTESAEDVLASFQGSFDDCPLDLDDVQRYIDSRKPTVSRSEINEAAREAYLESLANPGFHYVQVNPDGSVSQLSDSRQVFYLDDVLPRPAIVYMVKTRDTMTAEQIQAERDSDCWGAWFETNVYDLESKLEPSGVTLED